MRAALLGVALLVLAGCGDAGRYAQAVSVLVDVSGTYADQRAGVVDLVKAGILPGLQPGDSIVLITSTSTRSRSARGRPGTPTSRAR